MLKRLFICAALCAAGTLNGAILGSATPVIAGILANILSNDLGTVWDKVAKRLEGKDAILRNEDLTKAVGNAIAAIIAKISKEEQFLDYQDALKILAQRAAKNWSEISQDSDFRDDEGFDPLREKFLAQMFSQKPSEFEQVTALTPQDWEKLLNAWQKKDPEAMRDPDAMRYVAQKLHAQFPKALREVLKEDFAQGGKAFPGFIIDLLGEIRGAIGEQQTAILERLDRIGTGSSDNGLLKELERRNLDLQSAISQVNADFQEVDGKLAALEAQNTEAFKSLATQIESGFENIENLLAGIGIQLFRIEDKVDRVLEKVTAIENAVA